VLKLEGYPLLSPPLHKEDKEKRRKGDVLIFHLLLHIIHSFDN